LRNSGRWQGQMDFDLYKKIIDDLREFENPLKVLRLYKDGEPLLNKKMDQMVAYAKKAGVTDFIDTTTNGLLLDPERMKPILDAGLDRINISVNGMSSRQLFDFTGAVVDFQTYADNIRKLYEMKGSCEICIKIAGDFLSEDDKNLFFETFGDHADRIFIENIAPCWPEFDVKEKLGVTIEKGIYDQSVSSVITCPYIFYAISVNSDGSASLCFLDWARKLIIGDAKSNSIKEIWESEALFNYRVEHLGGNRGGSPVCAQCGQLTHGLPDNIDPYADTLLDKLKASRSKRSG